MYGSKVINYFVNQHDANTSRQMHDGSCVAYNFRKIVLATPSRF